MIITIHGPAGSGKGSVAKALAEKLKYKRYSVGDFRRLKAKELGMTLEEYNKLGEKDPSTDREADEWQKQLGLKQDNFVIDGRTGFMFIPHSVKVFLDVNDDVSAKRIFEDNKKNPNRINQVHVKTLAQQQKISMERNESDKERYARWYGIKDFRDKKHYDLYIDTSRLTIEEVTDKVLEYIKTHYK